MASKTRSAIATAKPQPRPPAPLTVEEWTAQQQRQHNHWLAELDQATIATRNQIDAGFAAAKAARDRQIDLEYAKQPPVDFEDVQRALAEERVALLVAFGTAIDETIKIAELTIIARRQAAGVEAAIQMAGVPKAIPVMRALPSPTAVDPDGDTEELRTIATSSATRRRGGNRRTGGS